MKIGRLNLVSKQQGMTLIEVLIAGMILFVSISAISLVARTKMLNQQKLSKSIEISYLAEYAVDIVKYHLKYTSNRQGNIEIAGRIYRWQAEIIESAPPRRVLDMSEKTSRRDLLILYKVSVSLSDSNKVSAEFYELIWEMQ